MEADDIRRRLQITCSDSLSLMTEHLEQTLSASDKKRFRAHLAGCEACAVYLDQLELTVDVTGSIAGDDTYEVDQPTMDRLVELFRETQDRA